MKIFKILLLSSFLGFSGCSAYESVSNNETKENEHFVLATLYMETAAECKALQIQAYNLARYRIGQYIENNHLTGNEAVVLDIDETVLETSLYQADMILNNFSWPTEWDEFINKADCRPVAGSLEFLNYIDSLGFKIFYVSNRLEEERSPTVVNLKKYNFPQVNDSSILLKTGDSSKKERREFIEDKNNIILLIGDNLGDFSEVLNRGSYTDRTRSVFETSSQFGDKFIILPNPTYGNWENSLSPDYWEVSSAERDKIRKEILRKLLNRTNTLENY